MTKSITTIFCFLILIFSGEENSLYAQPAKLKWYKGNTHTHTLNSDGDSAPDDVVRWYREHGYNFLVLTDHNSITKVNGLNSVFGMDERFIVIPGEEVTNYLNGKPLHVNALNAEKTVPPQEGKDSIEVMQKSIDGVREAKGVPQINHPNFGWALTADEILQLENIRLFEVFNGHPLVNNLGGGNGAPGTEAMWDKVLSGGKIIYGIADDDAHHFKNPWNKYNALPGQGWVYVRAETLSPGAIVAALDRGDFYASTGVELADYQATGKNIAISIREIKTSKYRIQFIGKNGNILSEVTTNPAVYQFRGDEMYVRAKIIESNGKMAWTQPVMLAGK